MTFFKLLRYDLSNGILYHWKRYALAFFLFLLFCMDYFLRWDMIGQLHTKIQEAPLSLGDYLSYGVSGIPEFTPSPQTPFIFPALWIVFYALLYYFLLSYPFQDLMGFGKHVLVSSKKRTVWWLSKCVWSIYSVALYFLVFYLAALLFTACSGGSFTFSLNEYTAQILSIPAPTGPTTDIMAVLFVLPLLTAVSFSLLQMTLSLFMKPFFSFGIVITCLLASAYYMSPYMLGNYAMLLRINVWSGGGLSPIWGVVFLVLTAFLSGLIGWYRFCRYDIINKE